MIDYLGLVREFHEKYGHYSQINHSNTYPNDVVVLREKLITEEAEEFRDASYALGFKNVELGIRDVDIEGIADALADLLYVVFGAAIAYGIPIDKVFVEVHRSNMTKSMLKDEKSIKGKTIKGDKYEPPRIKEVLFGVKHE